MGTARSQLVTPAPDTITAVSRATAQAEDPTRAGGLTPSSRRTLDSSGDPLAATTRAVCSARRLSMAVSARA